MHDLKLTEVVKKKGNGSVGSYEDSADEETNLILTTSRRSFGYEKNWWNSNNQWCRIGSNKTDYHELLSGGLLDTKFSLSDQTLGRKFL